MAACSMLSVLCALLSIICPALAHMEMAWPYPVRSPLNPANNYTDIDYSYTSPLFANGSNFPCKGYQNDRPIVPVVTYKAGGTYNMTIAGEAMHGGGSCQLSLSYDNGETFRVIKSMIGGCPLILTYDFTIPSYAPDGTALLAWSWFNLIGNREIYMDCAEINIDGSNQLKSPGRRAKTEAQQFSSFDDLPYIWKANLPGINTCVTVEGVTPVFPDPGPDVQYGAGFSKSSPPTPGQCDSATPYGQAYENLHDTGAGIYASHQHFHPLPPLKGGSQSSVGPSVPIPTVSTPLVTMSSIPSTPTCEPKTVTVTSTLARRHFRPKGFIDQLQPDDPCPTFTVTAFETKKHHHGKTKSNAHHDHTTHNHAPPTSTAAPTTSLLATATLPAPTSTNKPGFATGSLAAYLPCIPNTYLCTSNTTYAQCIWTSNTATGYIAMGAISGGNVCQPYSAPLTTRPPGGVSAGGGAPGTYRDDRIVLADPFGTCDVDGATECSAGGYQFLVCAEGAWVDMGPVAAGTRCTGSPGVIGAP